MTTLTSLISSSTAQGAYRNSKDLIADAPQKTDKPESKSFSEILQTAATEAITNVYEAEDVMQAGLQGNLNTQQIVEATMALESSVTVAVSVRDKFVAAYQEILRMPI
jgi:flagellar hook-basal body complex protein FliE